eukprot:TRINITY_DN70_c0_g1_i1.p1 TRINITY_DN70_c0_g1~~TRINITY_DN70_c0_g1_i1.p1  ORF type:complete len:257 (+),score=-3.45 TRINITY_DN70_c0_g1_i1:144-914(+)
MNIREDSLIYLHIPFATLSYELILAIARKLRYVHVLRFAATCKYLSYVLDMYFHEYAVHKCKLVPSRLDKIPLSSLVYSHCLSERFFIAYQNSMVSITRDLAISLRVHEKIGYYRYYDLRERGKTFDFVFNTLCARIQTNRQLCNLFLFLDFVDCDAYRVTAERWYDSMVKLSASRFEMGRQSLVNNIVILWNAVKRRREVFNEYLSTVGMGENFIVFNNRLENTCNDLLQKEMSVKCVSSKDHCKRRSNKKCNLT